MSLESFFSGPDRIEISPMFSKITGELMGIGSVERHIRKGSLDQLKASDFQRVKEVLEAGNIPEATERVKLLHQVNLGVTGTFLEWCVALPHILAKEGYAAQEPLITKAAYSVWKKSTLPDILGDALKREAFEITDTTLRILNSCTIGGYRSKKYAHPPQPNPETSFLAGPQQMYAAIMGGLAEKDCKETFTYFSDYFKQMRVRHDLARDFIHFYVSAIQQRFDQKTGITVQQKSLESCPFVKEFLWGTVRRLSPEGTAAFVAEHLRAHFSGPNREGSVEIVDEGDSYIARFAPCGTGQALRLKLGESISKFPSASPETWNLANEVPPYCSHCAVNELTSITIMGYPAWVTEFNPDPSKPCGWRIFKDHHNIPQKYWGRLGMEKPITFAKK